MFIFHGKDVGLANFARRDVLNALDIRLNRLEGASIERRALSVSYHTADVVLNDRKALLFSPGLLAGIQLVVERLFLETRLVVVLVPVVDAHGRQG